MKASINVEEGALELMSKGNLEEPVIMLNLLKYLDFTCQARLLEKYIHGLFFKIHSRCWTGKCEL